MDETETAFDPTRRLCPDGACVGVIGPDGRCTVCRRTAEAAATGAEAEAEAEDASPAGGAAQEGPQEGPHEGSGFNAARRLCDDGTCVGVIGPEGVCTVCGQKAE
jgi:hypothetical protein